MIAFTMQILQRLMALLAVTGALTQGTVADNAAVWTSQFPWYAALTQAPHQFDNTIYLGDNGLVLLSVYGKDDGLLSCPYIEAELYLPDVHALRTWYADDPASPCQGRSDIASAGRAIGAAFAVNGDFYPEQGVTAIRNGTILNSCVSGYDLCVLYEDGSLDTFRSGELSSQTLVNEALSGAWQAWSFGPALLEKDGSPINDFSDRIIEYLTREHPRTAIGYYGPGHYLLLNVSGYMKAAQGATLEELSAYFAAKGCTRAYNLDGGSSTHLWFNGRERGYPSRDVELADLIYLEDRVSGEGAP